MTNGVRPVPGYLAEDDCRLAGLIEVVSEKTDLADYPHASTVEQNVLMYDSARVRDDVASAEGQRDAQAELVRALHDGPGIVVFTGSGDPDVPGLGFRYDEDERWPVPNPTGREGFFEAYCPPHRLSVRRCRGR
jgi:hypothetical protein